MDHFPCIPIWLQHVLVIWKILLQFSKCSQILLYNIWKITFAIITTDLIRKVSKDWERYQAHSYRGKFSKILIFLWKLKYFSLATTTVNFISWNDILISFCFEKGLPNICQLKCEKSSISLSIVFFQGKQVCHAKSS